MLHVGDILFVGNKSACEDIDQSLKQFGHIGYKYLPEEETITFRGVEIRRMADGNVDLSQHLFYDKIIAPGLSEMVDGNAFLICKDHVRRRLKSFVGACIWLYQAVLILFTKLVG